MFLKSNKKRITASLLLILVITFSFAQKLPVDTLTRKQKLIRKTILLGSMGTYTAGSFAFLDLIWYRPYQTTAFHFYNDNAQWCQMDKWGHCFSTYSSARLVMEAMDWAGFETSPFNASLGHLSTGGLRWAGFSERESIIIGQSFGLLYLSSVEILDGFSKEWGFSWGDEVANFVGGFTFSLQQYYWREQKIQLKFSYHPTSFAHYRPNTLGGNWAEQIIKDYNGQTYWVDINIASLLKKETKFPNWINLAFGYGATNMVSGKNGQIVYPDGTVATNPIANQTELITKSGQVLDFYRYRKYYFSLDVDFTKIKTKSRVLKGIFSVVNGLKMPFPTLEFDKHGTHFKPFYF